MNIGNGKQTKLSKWLYLLLLGEYDGGIHQHKWIHFIKHILIYVGHPDLLNKEVIENPKSIKNQISKTLSDLYVQEWHNKVTSSSKGKNYNLFKQDLNFENYLYEKVQPESRCISTHGILKKIQVDFSLPYMRWNTGGKLYIVTK